MPISIVLPGSAWRIALVSRFNTSCSYGTRVSESPLPSARKQHWGAVQLDGRRIKAKQLQNILASRSIFPVSSSITLI
ncbi:hypothetical protein ['Paenibacillus yunnanensis' Narsing Rao et al. 2020]|uniref:hypothetical protein n=1 Tax=Paenibacillus tengchongensis TaxID=2608684 RepID=UPI001651CE5C|nr:hypothetical protein [Paenibacillus tengchongensis]